MRVLGIVAVLLLGGCASVQERDYWAELDHIYRMDIDSAPRVGEVTNDPLVICLDRDVSRNQVSTMQESGVNAWRTVIKQLIDSGDCAIGDGIILIEVGELWRKGYSQAGATIDIWDVQVADRENNLWWSSYYQRTGVVNPSQGI